VCDVGYEFCSICDMMYSSEHDALLNERCYKTEDELVAKSSFITLQ
jgi:hypothetical protein